MSRAWSSKDDEILVSLNNGEYGRRMRAICLKHKSAKQCADRWKEIRGYIWSTLEKNVLSSPPLS
ncbi:5316_t:CDS:2 [Paraglomus occultum]|uniref:5316_t:CDS:1 n=1 Tax=Paraglomus occultum TaxID=144539 RepID=A0A9N8Z0F2_9GLOM|nr:5316_t:CDS:2 [Paraglomus occultum]